MADSGSGGCNCNCSEVKIPEHFTSKSACVVLHDIDHKIWWFLFDKKVLCIDYLPDNYPELVVNQMDIVEAVKRLKEMTEEEGWEVIKDNLLDSIPDDPKIKKALTVVLL